MVIGFIAIIVMLTVFGIVFVDYMQQKQERGGREQFKHLKPHSYQ